jgi:uncharacterized RDD family membrane protein YckC
VTLLVTGEAVALDLRAAALPSRAVAAVIDGFAQLGLLFVLSLIVATAASGGLSPAAATAINVVVFLLVFAGYPVVFETLMRGRTPGKAAMGLRVVRDDGGPIAFRQAFVRGLASMFLERPGITLFSAAVVSSLLSPSGKRLGDLLAGTIVLQERIPAPNLTPPSMPPPLAAWAAELDLAGLPDDLAQTARTFLGRTELTAAARSEIGDRLMVQLTAVVGPPPPGTPGWAYLSAVLAERRRRAQGSVSAAPVPAYLPLTTPAPAPPSNGFALPS